MADCAWISEVVDSCFVMLGKQDGGGEEVMEDCVGIRDIDDTLVFGDLGDEGPRVQVVGDRHP